MNKKTLWIIGLVLVAAIVIALVINKLGLSESAMNGQTAKLQSESSSSPGGGGSSATSAGGSSSSCAYQCCGDADCASADGLSFCGSDHTCQLRCNAPSGAAACDENAKCNEQSGNCDKGCGSTFCPLGTSCVNDIYCAPNPPEPPGACTMSTQCAEGSACVNGTCTPES